MNILVTGANGYLGSELIEYLVKETGNNIYALDINWNNPKSVLNDKIKRIQFSLDELDVKRTFDEKQNIDLIIHLAAKVFIDQSSPKQAFELMQANCLNLIRLLDWAKEQETTKFIFASSMTVYAPLSKDCAFDEKYLKSPTSFYGLSKMFGEQIVEMYARQTKLRAIVLRLPGLFGGNRRSGLIYSLAKQIKSGKAIKIDLKGLGNWETINVTDVASIIATIVKKDAFENSFDVLNVGYEDKQSEVRSIIKLMQEYYKSSQILTIENENDYFPFNMNTKCIRDYLSNYFVDFKKSLFNYLGEIEE